jgi:DNA-binding protein HU-beta
VLASPFEEASRSAALGGCDHPNFIKHSRARAPAARISGRDVARFTPTKVDAKQIVDSILAAIVDATAGGDEVSLAGFGKFKLQSRPARSGRNPATGASIKIAASKKLAFTAAKAAKDALNSPKAKKAKKR